MKLFRAYCGQVYQETSYPTAPVDTNIITFFILSNIQVTNLRHKYIML